MDRIDEQQTASLDRRTLAGHLHNHWMAANAGVDVFRRVAAGHGDPSTAAAVARLAAQVDDDRRVLQHLMVSLGVAPRRVEAVMGRVGAALGRLKPNGRLLTRPPLTDIVELEALRTMVYGKLAGWEMLLMVADDEPRLDAGVLEHLRERAREQLLELEHLHLAVGRRRLTR